jgi:hypothetical protein
MSLGPASRQSIDGEDLPLRFERRGLAQGRSAQAHPRGKRYPVALQRKVEVRQIP